MHVPVRGAPLIECVESVVDVVRQGWMAPLTNSPAPRRRTPSDQRSRRDGLMVCAFSSRRYSVGPSALSRGNNLDYLTSDEMNGRVVVTRDPRRKIAIGEHPLVCGSSARLPVIVGAEAPGKQAQAVGQRTDRADAERVIGAPLEPAARPRAHPANDDARLPRRLQSAVRAVRPPHGEKVRRVARTDVHNILVDEEPLQIEVRRPLVQIQRDRLEASRREGVEKGNDVGGDIACGRW
jgi:hypothetical protein